MDERKNDVATKRLAVVLGVALLAFAAHQAFGVNGLTALVVLGVGAMALVVVHRLSGRSFTGVPGRPRPEADAGEPPVKDDAWRSERWVREAVERGLRSLEEWRIDQQAT